MDDFNDIKESALLAGTGKTYKLFCLVSGANHRISRQGNKFGSFILEDYSGKTEIVLFGDDYVRFQVYLEQGASILLTGGFKQRFQGGQFEFKPTSIALAENIKRNLTRQIQLEMDVRHVQVETIDFLEDNLRNFPGNATLRLVVSEKKALKAAFKTWEGGLEMNANLIAFPGRQAGN